MAMIRQRINKRAKSFLNSGFGTNSDNYGGRLINKDGSANVSRIGMGFLDRISWFHTLIEMPNFKFLSIVIAFYLLINLLFAMIYFAIGVEHLNGISADNSEWVQFGQAYFFSTQTFTTVGYGHISPNGFWASFVAAVEALIGLLSFAIATGLFFGRFSKPKAYLIFSKNALIAPYKDGKALMIRTSPYKNTNFTDAEVKVTLGIVTEENGVKSNQYYSLDLEFDKINSLNLSWTLVHAINENSPLFGFSAKDFENTKGEILIFIKTFDDMYATTVATRTSYLFDEIVYGAKFKPMFNRDTENLHTVLDLDKINDFETISFNN